MRIKPAGANLPGKTNRSMKAALRFPEELLAVLRQAKGLGIRAGKSQHRFVAIWVVVVKGRVFVRSWSVKANGWYRTFLKDPRNTIKIAGQEIAVRAVRIRR